jgi:1,2-diacylglycerol 3-alpha-glucosyltransferase
MVVAKYPATFGHTSVINYLCKELNELGYRAAIGAFSFDSEPPFNIETVKLNKRKLLTTGVSYLDFDIIHPHQARVLYYLLSKKPTKPIIFHYHGASDRIQELNFKLAMWKYKNKISKIISVSNAGINQMKKLVKDISADVLYNGVDTKLFNPNLGDPYKKGNPQLLFVSALRKYKKVEILINSIPSILKKFPDAHLQIVGDGENFATLESMIQEKKLENKVELLGKIEHDDLKFYYSSCDLYISASTFEVCPVPPIEAMACGKPLLLFDIEPHVEIINASKAGKIFSTTNPDDISELVSDVLQSKDVLEISARKFGEQHDWSLIGKQLSLIYEEF